MNKRKRVALKKRRIRASKLKVKRQQEAAASGTAAGARPARS